MKIDYRLGDTVEEFTSIRQLREFLRMYAPCTTTFRAIRTFDSMWHLEEYTILRFSPHIIGPCIAGYITITEA